MPSSRLPDINTILIAGTLVDDPQIEESEEGKLTGKFRILSVRRFRDNSGQWRESRCEVDVIVYQRLAELCQRNLRAGSPVLLDGELLSREETEETGGRAKLEIRARRVQFLERALRPVTSGEEETEGAGAAQTEVAEFEEQAPSEWDFGYRELEL